MGNESSVNLNDGRTKEEIQKFIERTEKATNELKETAANYNIELDTTEKIHAPTEAYRAYIEARYFADCVCNVPKTDFRNRDTREACVKAQLAAYDAEEKLFRSELRRQTFEIFSDKMRERINLNNRIVATNKPIFGSSQSQNV